MHTCSYDFEDFVEENVKTCLRKPKQKPRELRFISLCKYASELTGGERIQFCLCAVCNFIMCSVEIAERVGSNKVLRLVVPAYQISSPVFFQG